MKMLPGAIAAGAGAENYLLAECFRKARLK